jgi:hypothetical protein
MIYRRSARACFHLASEAADSADRLPAKSPSTLMSRLT